MPEGPEAHHICMALRRRLDCDVVGVSIVRQNGKYHEDALFRLIGHRAPMPFRSGKQIVFDISSQGEPEIRPTVCQLGMSGYWDSKEEPWTFDYVEGRRLADDRDVRVELMLESGRTLRFHDARLFGSFRTSGWPVVGPEVVVSSTNRPGTKEATALILEVAARSHPDWPIKRLLMDQGVIAGVGNIYATEALWLASMHPSRRCRDVSDFLPLLTSLRLAMGPQYDNDIDYGRLNVYRRKMDCFGHPISRIEVDKRSTYLCETCQS